MKARFLELFEFNRSMNEDLISHVDLPELLHNEEVQMGMSKALNAHGKWLARIEGKRPPYSEEEFHSPRDMDRVDQEHHEWARRIIEREDLDRTVRYRDELGRVSWELLSNILFHIIAQGIQQRSRVSMALERSGHKAPDLDYLIWCKEG